MSVWGSFNLRSAMAETVKNSNDKEQIMPVRTRLEKHCHEVVAKIIPARMINNTPIDKMTVVA